MRRIPQINPQQMHLSVEAMHAKVASLNPANCGETMHNPAGLQYTPELLPKLIQDSSCLPRPVLSQSMLWQLINVMPDTQRIR